MDNKELQEFVLGYVELIQKAQNGNKRANMYVTLIDTAIKKGTTNDVCNLLLDTLKSDGIAKAYALSLTLKQGGVPYGA